MVVGEGALQVGSIAEYDEAEPVRGVLVGQLGQHVLDRIQAIHAAAVWQGEIEGFHGARQVHRDHQVAPGFLLFHRGANPLGLGGG